LSDGGRQTGGPRQVVSGHAVGDRDLHRGLPLVGDSDEGRARALHAPRGRPTASDDTPDFTPRYGRAGSLRSTTRARPARPRSFPRGRGSARGRPGA
jgi:hypothetical protein